MLRKFGSQATAELKRFTKKVEAEAGRFGKKVEAELGRVEDRLAERVLEKAATGSGQEPAQGEQTAEQLAQVEGNNIASDLAASDPSASQAITPQSETSDALSWDVVPCEGTKVPGDDSALNAGASVHETEAPGIPEMRAVELRQVNIDWNSSVGSGYFADVFKATLQGRANDVVVKVLHEDKRICEKHRSDMLREIGLMYSLRGNIHIVHLITHTFIGDTPVAVLEYCSKGSLLDFVQEQLLGHKTTVSSLDEDLRLSSDRGEKLSLRDLLSFAFQISDGMAYLASKNFIHRDLAARNVLLNHRRTVKIADFGLSRHVAAEIYKVSRRTKFPTRWTAPEALSTGEITLACDVWSYGVALYEMFSVGAEPYESIGTDDVLRRVEEGFRMKKPTLCPSDMYELMRRCWEQGPKKRPTFPEIRSNVAKMMGYECTTSGAP